MTYGLIGERLGHSFSRIIQEYLTGEPYELKELRPEELGVFLRHEPFRGVNVTIPYKQAVIQYLDELAPSARLTGAVNVILRGTDGRLTGHNTDYDGFLAMAGAAGVRLQGSRVLILGAGGAAAAVEAAVRSEGASCVAFAVRHDFGPARLPLSDPSTFRDYEVVVNATPVGMYPDIQGKPLDISLMPHLRGVLDCVYNPICTRLVLDARERGIPAAGGLMMVVAQAVRAAELFHSTVFPEGTVERVYRWLLAGRRNIVLTGMPSSGKTTVGKLLAERLGLRFTDTDDVVRTYADASIPEIFARQGEEGFRRLESAAIESLAGEQGLVIATGGGAVLNPENVRSLRQNGVLLFLDRDPGMLRPTADRPLSASRSELESLYIKRLPVYIKSADCRISNDGTPEEAVERIMTIIDKV
jgi:shikimate dehydrogenase